MDFIHLGKSCINKAHIVSADWNDAGDVVVTLSNGSAPRFTGKEAEDFAVAIGHAIAHFDGATFLHGTDEERAV